MAIQCSHPHADHVDGLIKLVEYKANKPGEIDLTHFDRVIFIDSGYPTEKSLPTKFEKNRGKPVTDGDKKSALAENAFVSKELLELFPEMSDLHISNSIYEPEIGSSQHGHSIVTLEAIS